MKDISTELLEIIKEYNVNTLLPNNVKQMINNFKAIQNPQAYLQQQLNSNPQFKSVIQASNENYEKAFRDMAQQMNVDPNEIINMLKK